jgi:DNA-binding NtrC family response regulator
LKTILIVDRDLGFVFWLGQILDAAGYVAVPAKGVADAAEIVATLRLPVDVLIAPAVERGVGEFMEKLRFSSPDLQVIALASEEDPAWAMPPPGPAPPGRTGRR